jgi:hypothetical protein
MTNRLERLREYAKPTREGNWQGASRDQANIDRFSERASEESRLAPRGRDGSIELPATGKSMANRDTSMSPRTSRKIDAAMSGRDDLNHVGSSYMAGTRRQT